MHKAQRSPLFWTTLSWDLWLELMWHTERSINKVKEQSSWPCLDSGRRTTTFHWWAAPPLSSGLEALSFYWEQLVASSFIHRGCVLKYAPFCCLLKYAPFLKLNRWRNHWRCSERLSGLAESRKIRKGIKNCKERARCPHSYRHTHWHRAGHSSDTAHVCKSLGHCLTSKFSGRVGAGDSGMKWHIAVTSVTHLGGGKGSVGGSRGGDEPTGGVAPSAHYGICCLFLPNMSFLTVCLFVPFRCTSSFFILLFSLWGTTFLPPPTLPLC